MSGRENLKHMLFNCRDERFDIEESILRIEQIMEYKEPEKKVELLEEIDCAEICGLLTVAFITLKLLGKIDWSWLWVLSPLWIGGGFGLILLGILSRRHRRVLNEEARENYLKEVVYGSRNN